MTTPPSPDDPWRPPSEPDGTPRDQPYPWSAPAPGSSPPPMAPLGDPVPGSPEDRPVTGPPPDPQASPYFTPTSDAPRDRASGPPFWLGVVAGFLSPVLLGIPAALLGDAASYLPLLALVGVVGLIVYPPTRRFGLGTLLGVALLAIIGAGACVLLIGFFLNEMG